MAQVFVSHSSKDNEQVALLLDGLAATPTEVVSIFCDFDVDTGIHPGDAWEQRIYSEIASCSVVVIALSSNWLNSKWCHAELALARFLGKTLFPVVLSPCDPGSLLAEVQQIYWYLGPPEGSRRLSAQIRSRLGNRVGRFPPYQNPYPGLQAFTDQFAPVYFGRTSEVEDAKSQILRQLQQQDVALRLFQDTGRTNKMPPGLLVIHGASGVGKSSFLRAGLRPTLSGLQGSESLRLLPPLDFGRDPLAHLISVVESACGLPTEDMSASRDTLEPADPIEIVVQRIQKRIALADRAESRVRCTVLVLDQIERMLGASRAVEAHRLMDVVLSLISAPSPRVFLVLSLRSDALTSVSEEFGLRLSTGNTFHLGSISEEGLREAIWGPAMTQGVKITPALVETIVKDAGGQRGDVLPMIACALHELWAKTQPGLSTLDISDYRVRLPDGLWGSVSQSADAAVDMALEAWPDLDPSAFDFALALCLAETDERGSILTRTYSRKALSRIEPILSALVESRLFLAAAERDVPIIQVAHEAIFRKWPRAAEALDNAKELMALDRRIRLEAVRWAASGRPVEHLTIRGRLIGEAARLLEDVAGLGGASATGLELEFVEACQRHESGQNSSHEVQHYLREAELHTSAPMEALRWVIRAAEVERRTNSAGLSRLVRSALVGAARRVRLIRRMIVPTASRVVAFSEGKLHLFSRESGFVSLCPCYDEHPAHLGGLRPTTAIPKRCCAFFGVGEGLWIVDEPPRGTSISSANANSNGVSQNQAQDGVSWLSKLPPGLAAIFGPSDRDASNDIWLKCPISGELHYRPDVEAAGGLSSAGYQFDMGQVYNWSKAPESFELKVGPGISKISTRQSPFVEITDRLADGVRMEMLSSFAQGDRSGLVREVSERSSHAWILEGRWLVALINGDVTRTDLLESGKAETLIKLEQAGLKVQTDAPAGALGFLERTGQLTVVDADGLRLERVQITTALKVTAFAISVSHDLVSYAHDGALLLRQLSDGRMISRLVSQGDEITCMRFSPSARYLATCDAVCELRLWRSLELSAVPEFEERSLSIAMDMQFDAEEQKLAVLTSPNNLLVYDITDIVPGIARFLDRGTPSSVACTSAHLGVCDADGSVRIYSFETRSLSFELSASVANARAIWLFEPGSIVVVVDRTGALRIWRGENYLHWAALDRDVRQALLVEDDLWIFDANGASAFIDLSAPDLGGKLTWKWGGPSAVPAGWTFERDRGALLLQNVAGGNRLLVRQDCPPLLTSYFDEASCTGVVAFQGGHLHAFRLPSPPNANEGDELLAAQKLAACAGYFSQWDEIVAARDEVRFRISGAELKIDSELQSQN